MKVSNRERIIAELEYWQTEELISRIESLQKRINHLVSLYLSNPRRTRLKAIVNELEIEQMELKGKMSGAKILTEN